MQLSGGINNSFLGNNITLTLPKQQVNQTISFKQSVAVDTFNGKSIIKTSTDKVDNNLFNGIVEFLGKKIKQNTRKNIKKHKPEKQRSSNRNNNYSEQKPQRSKRKSNNQYVRPKYEYQNMFPDRLKAEPNPNLKKYLKNDNTIYDVDKAYTRITSLSKYLKELMVGFVTPDGEHWFQEAMPYLLKGAVGKNIPEESYFKAAMSFWGLLSKADYYWISDDFVEYLQSMNQTPAVKATINAVSMLQKQAFVPKSKVAFTGYPSKIKYIPELYNCAYSGVRMNWNGPQELCPSAEHILPHSTGRTTKEEDALNVDVNYLVVSSQANSDRGNIPLVAYLKGWDAEEYQDKVR